MLTLKEKIGRESMFRNFHFLLPKGRSGQYLPASLFDGMYGERPASEKGESCKDWRILCSSRKQAGPAIFRIRRAGECICAPDSLHSGRGKNSLVPMVHIVLIVMVRIIPVVIVPVITIAIVIPIMMHIASAQS